MHDALQKLAGTSKDLRTAAIRESWRVAAGAFAEALKLLDQELYSKSWDLTNTVGSDEYCEQSLRRAKEHFAVTAANPSRALLEARSLLDGYKKLKDITRSLYRSHVLASLAQPVPARLDLVNCKKYDLENMFYARSREHIRNR